MPKKSTTQAMPSKPKTQTKRMRQRGKKQDAEFVRYMIENQARNKPDSWRWISFTRYDGHLGPVLLIHVFDLDIDPTYSVGRTSITGGLGALLYQQDGVTVDFTTMNQADAESWTETGILPKGYYG